MRPVPVKLLQADEVNAGLRGITTAMGSLILDLGCGHHKCSGALGVDRVALPGVDVVHNLADLPYPLGSSCADEIHMYHVLEHLPDTIAVLSEVWRVCKPGAKVYIRVPHYSGIYAWKDPTHVRCFTLESFDYFGNNPWSYYTRARFKVTSARLQYFMTSPERRSYRYLGRIVQWLLDRHPTFGERFLAHLVGGIDELRITLEAVKEAGSAL